jgi:hypothetical protein
MKSQEAAENRVMISYVACIFTKNCYDGQIKRHEMDGHVARMWDTRKAFRKLVCKPGENKPPGRPGNIRGLKR